MKLLVAQPIKPEEAVKDLQEKVISIQDHQISFLNDSLANFLSYAGWIVSITSIVIVGIQIGIGLFLRSQNKKTEEKMQAAERKMSEAEQKLTEVEQKSTKAEFQIEQAKQLGAKADEMLEQLQAQQNKIEGLLNSKELEEKLKEIDKISDTSKILEAQVRANSYLSEAGRILNQGLDLYVEQPDDSSTIKHEIRKARLKCVSLQLKIKSRKYEVDTIITHDNSTIFSVIPRESRELYDEAIGFLEEAKEFVETYRTEAVQLQS
ncbi:hypothetical protein FO497_13460 [Bacillus cereus ATCC 10876]|uniref:hypothetical protein n=1 Tax=Bacillus TaxID=1386 RepID=UPI00019FF2A7|nr:MULTISPECIES: hypothetical protein [Bacillus]MDJ0280711.1 hypothetical protein [Bacillus bombysepticus]EEK47965.1 spbB protein [Bacillus cereus ATCC 10876]KFL78890.1 putative spbB protein [Bacillus cereus ATCC 10876]MBG9866017.1 hypothetical protein [Bacillus cereus]MBO1128293.1 hypothetical protein [Bacillus cereus]